MERKSSFNFSIKIRSLQNGNKTWECFVSSEELGAQAVLAESDHLVAELEERYPVTKVTTEKNKSDQ